MADNLRGVEIHSVGILVTHGESGVCADRRIHIVGHCLIAVRSGVGVDTMDIHIHNNLIALAVSIQIIQNIQQLRRAGLADDGALQGAGAAKPRSSGNMAVNHQRIVLALGQSKAIAGSEAVYLLIQFGQVSTQRGIRLLLGNGVLVVIGSLGPTIDIKMVLLTAHRAISDAVLRTAHIIAGSLKLLQLLQNRNC